MTRLLATSLIALLLSPHLGACAPQPEMSAEIKEGRLILALDRDRANGFLGLRMEEEATGEMLWHVNLHYFPGGEVTYGEAPQDFRTWNNNPRSAQDVVPAQALPTTPILVSLSYQYDVPPATAAGANLRYRLEVNMGRGEVELQRLN